MQKWEIVMEYKRIDELNCDDAVRHLLDARQSRDPAKITEAEDVLRNALDLIGDVSVDRLKCYSDHLSQNYE